MMQQPLYRRVSLIAGISGISVSIIKYLININDHYGVSQSFCVDFVWATLLFGILHLFIAFQKKHIFCTIQPALFYLYSFVMFYSNGVRYDVLVFYIIAILLFKKYNFFRKNILIKISCCTGSPAIIGFIALMIRGATLKELSELGYMAILIIATMLIICLILKNDIKRHQDLKWKQDQEKMELLGRQAANAAHYIRNSLNPLAMAVEMKCPDIYTIASTTINQITAHLDQMYAIAGRNTRMTCPVIVSVKNMIENILETNKSYIAKYDVTLETSFYSGSDNIHIDPQAFTQIIFNLLSNSIKATEKSKTRKIKIATNILKDRILIQFSDTGCGMKPEIQRQIFDQFYQGHNYETHGLGLGMHHVKGLIDKYGGTIKLKSEVNVGTIFSITFPLKAGG